MRDYALERFSASAVRQGRPLATLEEVLVPTYLLHRFQLQAVGKLIGGSYFSYALRGDGQQPDRPVPADRQRAALDALLQTLRPGVLRLPADIVELLPPRPPGYSKTRETFPSQTGATFDPYGPARSAAALTLAVLLEPTRAARLEVAHAADEATLGFNELTRALLNATWLGPRASGVDGAVQRAVNSLTLDALLRLSVDEAAATQVRALAGTALDALEDWLDEQVDSVADPGWQAHYRYARERIESLRDDPQAIGELPAVTVPPGSPIGADGSTGR
ncbi:MAG: zinc-dependent metalloprotease [Woeseiaceae bacterium]|nr:zinc-dependent metalloprotease [Woeseiaceae bacterium]